MKRERYEKPEAEVVRINCTQVLMSSAGGEQRDDWDTEE